MFISIDLGGTKTRVASTIDLKHITEETIFKTVQEFELEQDTLLKAIDEVSENREIDGICLGVPGLVGSKERRLDKIVNVPSFSDLSFSEVFANKYPADMIYVVNDAALAGLGEATLGAGADYDVIAYLTLSTGVGGIRISGKRLDPYQSFSEPGHMIINPNGPKFDMCGHRGCLSSYVSGTGFSQLYGESPIGCTNQNFWNDYAKNLAIGLTNIISMWSPNLIILGGSMTLAYKDYIEAPLLNELAKEVLFEIPSIEIASLGDNAGVYGGFVYLSQLLNK